MSFWIQSFIIWIIYKTLQLTWRVSYDESTEFTENLKNKTPMILAHWHGDELSLIHLARRYRIATIVSTSKDGERMNGVLKLLGGTTSRGSSTRGGVSALRRLIRLVRSGYNCSFAVDGPKGPLHSVKPGVFELSRMISNGNTQIFAAGVYCDRAWRFPKSWNQAYLPKPFARLHIMWRLALPGVTKDQDPKDPQLAESLSAALQKTRLLAAQKNGR
jgi:lysophospholipid acyltransferase (LPLAT)-like uncharacterized protein